MKPSQTARLARLDTLSKENKAAKEAADRAAAEIDLAAHRLAAGRNMCDLLFHVALKVEQLSRCEQFYKADKIVRWGDGGAAALLRFGRALAMARELQPNLSPLDLVKVVEEHGLFPKELIASITLGEAIAILSVPPDEAAK